MFLNPISIIKHNGYYLLAVLPALAFYFICTWHGNLQSPDSEYYLYIAQNLVENGLYYGPGNRPIIYWPPIYVLAIIPGIFISNYIFILHLILLTTHQVVWVRIFKYYVSDRSMLALLSALMGFNTLILMVSIFIWSEILFMTLFSFSILSLIRYKEKHNKSGLFVFSLCFALCMLTRNAGIFFLPAFFIIGIFYFDGKDRWVFWLYLAVSSLGNLAWNIHRIFILDHPEAIQGLFPSITIWRNINLTIAEIVYNFLPRQSPGFFITLFVITGFILFSIRIRTFRTKYLLPVLLVVSYLFFWFIIPANKDNIGRFVTPVTPIVLMIFCEQIQVFNNNGRRYFFFAISGYLIVYSISRIMVNTLNWSTVI